MENKIDSYKIFESVARNESISKASEELFISQPAVSQSIKRLEEIMGGELFNRTKFGVKLTSEGKIFYDQIKKGLDHIENAERLFSSLKNIQTGTVRIGASASITKHILMPYLKTFHNEFPNINIEIVNHLSNTLITMLKGGLLDLLVVTNPVQDCTDLNVNTFATITDVFCASPEYMDTNKTYTLQELKNYKLIVQKKPSNTRAYLDNFLKEQVVKLIPSTEAVSQNIVANLTQIGFGYAFLPKEFITEELFSGSLKILNTPTPAPRKIAIITHKNSSQSFACQKLINIITNNQ